MKIRLRLSFIFILINSVILSLPVAGIALMKLYDSTLIRQTENELITQAVMLANIYTKQLKEQFPNLDISQYGRPLGHKYWPKEDPTLGKWRPVQPSLDLNNSPVFPQEQAPEDTTKIVDPIAWKIGMGFDNLLKTVQLTTLSGMRILDSNGIIVSSTGWIKKKTLSNRPEVVQALEGEITRVIRETNRPQEKRFFSSISRTSSIRIHVTYPIILEKRIIGAVNLIRTPANVYQHIYQNRQLFISYGVLILAITLAISFFMAYAITRPIKALVAQARKATNGANNQLTVLKHPVTAEFELLSETLVIMFNKQKQRAEQIKNFASYVSHEFKTPITAIKGATEILQDHIHDLSDQEQIKFLTSIAINSQRMQLLMKQLTELAKADIQKMPSTPCNLTPVIEEQITYYQHKFTEINFIKTDITFPVYMNKELLKSIINNLFENAVQHGGDIITIELILENKNINLFFADNGKGITKPNAKRIFEPFFSTKKHSGGTGLGLAIISTLLASHGGEITLVNSRLLEYNTKLKHHQGCLFKITFPTLN